MFVGEYLQLGRYRKLNEIEYLGAAIGSLGRHTQITPDGMPVFDDRVEVLFKVGGHISKLIHLNLLILASYRSSTSRN